MATTEPGIDRATISYNGLSKQQQACLQTVQTKMMGLPFKYTTF